MAEFISEKQDLTYLEWSRTRRSSGTAGSFLKAASEFGAKKIYYKLSNYDSINGITGHESVNELIVDRLLTVLGVEHLSYRLIHADVIVNGQIIETYLCASEDFKERGEEKMALDVYYDAEKTEGETPLEFCARLGFWDYIYKMLVVDFLILNRDRHGANIELLRNRKKKTVRLAPLFDHGLSLLAPCRTREEIERFDVLYDRPVQSWLGSRSSYENLKLIPRPQLPRLKPLSQSDRGYILGDLHGVLDEALLNKIWDMLWGRWRIYEDFCNQK